MRKKKGRQIGYWGWSQQSSRMIRIGQASEGNLYEERALKADHETLQPGKGKERANLSFVCIPGRKDQYVWQTPSRTGQDQEVRHKKTVNKRVA